MVDDFYPQGSWGQCSSERIKTLLFFIYLPWSIFLVHAADGKPGFLGISLFLVFHLSNYSMVIIIMNFAEGYISLLNYTPPQTVLGGYTVLTLSFRPSVHNTANLLMRSMKLDENVDLRKYFTVSWSVPLLQGYPPLKFSWEKVHYCYSS